VSTLTWGSWPDIYYCLRVTVLFLWGSLSDRRAGLSFVYAAGSCQRNLSEVRVPWDSWPYFDSGLGTRDHILLSQIWDFPFRRLLRLAGSRWRYSTMPPHGFLCQWTTSPRYIAPARTAQETSLPLLPILSLPGKQCIRRAAALQRLLYCRLFTQFFLGNGSTCHNTNPTPVWETTHYVSATKHNRLMLVKQIIAVCCENHTEHINTVAPCWSRWYILLPSFLKGLWYQQMPETAAVVISK
jgi:hypothetical protein